MLPDAYEALDILSNPKGPYTFELVINEAVKALLAQLAVPCSDPVIPAVTFIEPVTVIPLPDTIKLPVIKADPLNGNPLPLPPAEFKAYDAVKAYDALVLPEAYEALVALNAYEALVLLEAYDALVEADAYDALVLPEAYEALVALNAYEALVLPEAYEALVAKLAYEALAALLLLVNIEPVI